MVKLRLSVKERSRLKILSKVKKGLLSSGGTLVTNRQ